MTRRQIETICWKEFVWRRSFKLEQVHEMLAHLATVSSRGAVIWEIRARDGLVRHLLGADSASIRKITEALQVHGEIEFYPVDEHMIADAKAGKIDLILTKSISRFARNTVDTLQIVRELSTLKIEVIFEKEGIRTLDKQCEVMLTIRSSLAQEESRSISENVRWGVQKSMQDGNISLPYKRFLGYKKGEDGRPEIVPEEAEIIRDIYRMFLDGKTIRTIADILTERGIKTPGGKDGWSVSTVKSILSNEKYKGDALRQKTYTVDYLSKTVRKNNGEVKQYYVSNSHEAIIDEDTFNLVQAELERRSNFRSALRDNSIFSTKIICGECGYFYGRKVLHSNSKKHRKVVWYCNHRYDGDEKCASPSISESDI